MQVHLLLDGISGLAHVPDGRLSNVNSEIAAGLIYLVIKRKGQHCRMKRSYAENQKRGPDIPDITNSSASLLIFTYTPTREPFQVRR